LVILKVRTSHSNGGSPETMSASARTFSIGKKAPAGNVREEGACRFWWPHRIRARRSSHRLSGRGSSGKNPRAVPLLERHA
jgi:hypothetical protein